jgi:hypothetical protein
MDKKDRPESTGKKPSAKKKTEPKKSVSTKGVKKKALKKKGKPTTKAAKPKAKAKKATAAKKPKVSSKDLLLKKFDIGVVPEMAAPPKAEPAAKIPDPPPFVTGYDKNETKRIRVLLFKEFDLAAVPLVKEDQTETVEKAAAPMPDTFERPKYEPPGSVLTGGPGPIAKAIKFGLCGVAMLLMIIVGASMSNRAKFHLKNADGAVQVERGKFAPSGTELVMSLNGMEMPSPVRDVYSEQEVYSVVSNYFQKQADAALNEPGGPDFAKIKRYLHQAALYAPTKESRDLAQLRLKGMNFLVLLHNADVSLTRGTLPDLQAAKAYLGKAGTYASMDYQSKLLGERQAVVDRMIAALKAE